MTPTKVVHITTADLALRYLLLNQLRYLMHKGYAVIGISSPGQEVPVLQEAGILHVPVPMTRTFTPHRDLLSFWHLYRAIRRESPAIVHTHNAKPGLLGQLAARLARVPVVVNTVHGFYFHDNMEPPRRRFYIALEKIAAFCSDMILSQNSEDIQTAVREGICAPSKITYLGNGIDVERFDRVRIRPEDIARKRQEIGLPDGAPVVGFVGRLVREKGLIELFEAARIVHAAVPAARFLFIGAVDWEKPDALTPSSAEKYEISHISYFLGMRHDMPELYALMDVFVLPSYREGFPRAPMEASAMGVSCVVTDIRGCREAVEEGCNGVLVPPRSVKPLADAICSLLGDPSMRRRMGQSGRRLALERFDERRVFSKVVDVYEQLLRDKSLS